MLANRGIRALVVTAVALLAPAGCSSSGADAPASAGGDAPSFEVRPVLSERAATKNDCTVTQVVGAPATAPIDGICSSDKSVRYSLGPASVTGGNVATVSAVGDDGQGTAVVTVDLDDAGTANLATLTSRANAQKAPRNQFAVVIDGAVVTAPQVTQGGITGGLLDVSFHDGADAKAFVASWPENKRTTETPGADAPGTAVPLSTRCDDLLDEMYERTYPVVIRTITQRSGTAESAVIRDVYPNAGKDDEFTVCTTPPTAAMPSPGAATCAPGLTAYEAEPTWLIDAEGTASELSRRNRDALLASSGMACF